MCLAVPGCVVAVDERAGSRQARVAFGPVVKDVCLDFVPQAVAGDYVLVHVGFAIGRIDAGEAERTLALLRQTGALAEELGSSLGET